MKIKHVVLAMVFGAFFASCENDDNGGEPLPLGAYENGILVINEGPFQNGSGTISFLSEDLETNEAAIYNKVNNKDLGNIIQSIGFADDMAYVIANVSNKIEVINRNTFESEGTINTGLSNPRYFVAVNGKGYVTNWGDTSDETDDFIAVINLATNTVESTIPVALGPEAIVAKENTLYIAHQGAFGTNSIVSVIDATSEDVTKTLEVGKRPNSLVLDANDNLWVLASGGSSWPVPEDESAGVLSEINTSTNEVVTTINFNGVEHPSFLNIDGDNLYYNLGKDVYTLKTTEDTLPTSSYLTHTATSLYGMDVYNGKLYVADAIDFASNGTLTIYDLNTKAVDKTFTVGLNPNGVYFNE